jgi:hypothetical protein
VLNIIDRLFAQAPLATIALGLLLCALGTVMVTSLVAHLRVSFKARGERSVHLLKHNMAVDWQRAGDSFSKWEWAAADQQRLAAIAGVTDWVVGPSRLHAFCALGASLGGLLVMGWFALTTLSELPSLWAERGVLFMSLAPLVVCLYCVWVAWGAARKLLPGHLGQRRVLYTLTEAHAEVANTRFAWADLLGVGRAMAPSFGGEKLTDLMLWLPSKKVLKLDISGINCHAHMVAMLVEQFWQRSQQRVAVDYAAALDRVAGLFLPIRNPQALVWEVSTELAVAIQHDGVMHGNGMPISAGTEFFVDAKPSGCLWALCVPIEHGATQIGPPFAKAPAWDGVGRHLLARIAGPLASTYAQIDGPNVSTQPVDVMLRPPAVALMTELHLSQIKLPANMAGDVEARSHFKLLLCLDGQLVQTLHCLDHAHSAERMGYATYLEAQVMPLYAAFTAHKEQQDEPHSVAQ